MIKICHMSSVHRGLDVRIFHKECVSLAQAGYETHLVIAASSDDVIKAAASGVTLHPLPASEGRLVRILKQAWRCYWNARRVDAVIYQFHDPELIPYGILLKLSGKTVIYDVHEDLPRDILDKHWIPQWMRWLVAAGATAAEHLGARWFFQIVTATPAIAERFRCITPNVANVNNYPTSSELAPPKGTLQKKDQVCYVGGISRVRGLRTVIEALPLVPNVRLVLCGKFSDSQFERELRTMPGWEQVDYLGHRDRSELQRIMAEAVAGLVIFLPIANHVDAQPNKIFEYMSAELPVIASDFPLWREVVQDNGCGICVDPQSPREIAGAISRLVNSPDEARRMGRTGRGMIVDKFNWPNEAEKLIRLYESCQ